jgi:hypothetical protein
VTAGAKVEPQAAERLERFRAAPQKLAVAEALADPAWAEWIRELVALSRTYADVAEEVYGTRVEIGDDDEGPLQDTWSDDPYAYVPAGLVLDKVLAAPAAAAHPRWAELTILALRTAVHCDHRPKRTTVKRVLAAGRAHPERAAVSAEVTRLKLG